MKSLAETDSTKKLTPIDYLVIGHIAKDQTPEGDTIGGTAAYAGRTAHAHGLCVGLLTSFAGDLDLSPLEGLQIRNLSSESTTTFENRYTTQGREQFLRSIARPILADDVPKIWHQTPLVHLGPIANEVERDLFELFSNTFIGVTPQGWLRERDEDGKVGLLNWKTIRDILPLANAVVISLEDLGNADQVIPTLAEDCQLLVVTNGANGARVFFRGEQRHFPAPQLIEVNPTGAGDIFAATFFIHYKQHQEPWEAARVATNLAAKSVTREGVESSPSRDDLQAMLAEVRG